MSAWLERMRAKGDPIVTAGTGVKNHILEVNQPQGWVELMSEQSRSRRARKITVGLLRLRDRATAHGTIVRRVWELFEEAVPTGSGHESGWVGPFQVRDLLERCTLPSQAWPPEDRGVYLVSRGRWKVTPTQKCDPLYVGGITGRSARFCTRVGDLIADLLGFYGASTGHSSGGQSLHRWCTDNGVNPLDLFLGWYHLPDMSCREEENRWFDLLAPKVNKIRPPRSKP